MATTRFGMFAVGWQPVGSFAGRSAATATTSAVTVIFRPAGRRKFYADIMFDMMTKRTLSETMTMTFHLR